MAFVKFATGNDYGGQKMANAKVAEAFHEIKQNPPAVLASTRKKSGVKQAHKQAVAIALSKARQAGASIPEAPKHRKRTSSNRSF